MSLLSRPLSRRNRIWWLIAAVIADRLVTLPNYHMEANPLVTALTPAGWILITTVVLTIALLLWRMVELWEYALPVAVVTATAILHAVVVCLNLYVVYAV